MRDRLMEVLSKALDRTCGVRSCAANVETNDSGCLGCLAGELLANGVIVPPVKVGDVVYSIANREVEETVVRALKMELVDDHYVWFVDAQVRDPWCKTIEKYTLVVLAHIFGKTVFLTREDAEQSLKGGAGK